MASLETQFFEAADYLRSLIHIDAPTYLHASFSQGKNVLAEGAQGSLLDIGYGSYPYVTSSHTTAAGVCTGLGVAPNRIGEVYGVFKAYCTRVGSGPFPTELHDEHGELMRQEGHEFGATTGRPRRCGWIDLPLLRYAIYLSGVTQLVMTKADVLSAFTAIQACEAYQTAKGPSQDPPFYLESASPIYREFESWPDITQCRQREQLPQSVHNYIHYLEQQLGSPVSYISTGPDREQIC